MALGFVQVPVDRVGHLLGREMAEVHGLPRIGPDAGGNEHQPGQQLAAQLGRALGQELAGLLGEVEQDGVAVEHDGVAVDDGRRLAVRIDGKKRGLVLLALARVDRDQLVIEAGLLQEQTDFRGVGRGVVVELDQRASPLQLARSRRRRRVGGKSHRRVASVAASRRRHPSRPWRCVRAGPWRLP